MKRWMMLALCFMLTLSLTACTAPTATPSPTAQPTEAPATQAPTATPEPTEAPSAEELARLDVGSNVESSPAAFDGMVVIGTRGGRMLGVRVGS